MRPELLYKRLTTTARHPVYATTGAACFDLSLDAPEPVVLHPSTLRIVGTGLAFAIPADHVMKVYVRSSMGFKHGIQLANGTGIIDSDYRGEVKLALFNHGKMVITLHPGDRIAQAAVEPAPQWAMWDAQNLPETIRGEAGFGSTGV